MRQKTAIITGLLILTIALLVLLVTQNSEVLMEDFNLWGIHMPVAWVLALALGTGFLSFAVWLTFTGVSKVATRWVQNLGRRRDREAEERYLKGLDAILGDRPLEAVNHFEKALEFKPDYFPTLLKLGDALRSLNQIEEALEAHRKALALRPNELSVLYALVEDHLAVDNHEEAKRFLQEILRIQPKRALHALRVLRNLYIKERNWRRALEIQNRIAEARVLDEERAADEPYRSGILYQIGVDLIEQGKFSDAAAQLEKVRKKFPAFVPAYVKLAEAYIKDGREEQAVEVYLQGYREAGSTTCLLAMEKFYLDSGQPEENIRKYQALIASTDKKILPQFLLGRLYYRLEVMDKAESLFKKIEGGIRQSGLLQYYLGRIRERRGDTAKACGHYRDVIRILNPFELSYHCRHCGRKNPSWTDYCDTCRSWGTYVPDFKDDLIQEIEGDRPIFYREIKWDTPVEAP
ncbi:MAG: tetratricopeptide repeat protein [Acidobacteriota bacterium]|jgi:tetratricopeptide (TPR) repeat protein